MTFARNSLAIIVAATGSFIGPSIAQAASSHHIDKYAIRFQRQATQLIRALNHHYRHIPQFRHLMADASEIVRDAEHVHDVAHHNGNLAHLDGDLRKLDYSVHHLDELINEIEYHVAHCHRSRCEHFHGDIRPARRLISKMQNTLHHLRDDVRTARYRPHHGHGHRHGNRHGAGYRRGHRSIHAERPYGVSFGGRGWAVRWGS